MLELALLMSTLVSIERVHVTGYCPCPVCCGRWADGVTASMTVPTPEWTLASRQFPIGTRVVMDGRLFKVEDRGGPVRRGFDRYHTSHSEALKHGRQDKWAIVIGG